MKYFMLVAMAVITFTPFGKLISGSHGDLASTFQATALLLPLNALFLRSR